VAGASLARSAGTLFRKVLPSRSLLVLVIVRKRQRQILDLIAARRDRDRLVLQLLSPDHDNEVVAFC